MGGTTEGAAVSAEITRPNVRDQLLRLRDFQRDTVEHVFSRLYDPVKPARRFLVADEVGLGKTFVARGLIAKIVDHLWDQVQRIDIIYICSNASIARQNIKRLNISSSADVALPSRITLLPTVIHGLERRKLNLVSLTPQTSFDLRSSLGTAEERALLYWLLPEDWKAQPAGIRNILQGTAERRRFAELVKNFDTAGIDTSLKEKYCGRLRAESRLFAEFQALCDRFAIFRQNIPSEDRQLQRDVVGKLRLQLAISCLNALEPDLIILDEFQRFKHLLDGTEQAADLASKLFSFNDARVLLLSATPYKMFTTADDASVDDDHYRDFLQTVRFLSNDDNASDDFELLLSQYRDELLRVSGEDTSGLRARKIALERALCQVMVRTERLAVTPNRDGMLSEVPQTSVDLQTNDLSSYVALARVAKALKHHDIVEYWKSAPYILNFMDNYALKQDFAANVDGKRSDLAIVQALANAPDALLSWNDVESYLRLDPGNARLRGLTAETIGAEMWRLLWMPPSLPYYGLSGPFGNLKSLTKRLVFSSWQVVPKVVASLLSYEAERLMFGALAADEERPNSQVARAKRRPLLRFSRSDGRLTGLPLFSLLYPSVTLAQEADPLSIFRESTTDEFVIAGVLEQVSKRIAECLKNIPGGETSGSADERWYWAAPILLDLQFHPESTRNWLAQPLLPSLWRGEQAQSESGTRTDEGASEADGNEAWREHVAEARRVSHGRMHLGPRPADLVDVLARLAIGGPATVALRALSRICGGPMVLEKVPLRNEAAAIGWAFRSLFNLPDVTALIRGTDNEEPYWLRVVQYCIDGCLQSVLDEFAHVLLELEGVTYRPANEAASIIAKRMRDVLQLRAASLVLDIFDVDSEAQRITSSDKRMRARFAARFGANQRDEGTSALRQDDVRAAFNSPFWPFVLCSTSVGQEGLDFHPYCHAVVHWNLPSNPVDLEQREGRVHRYKGHAVRKNVAASYNAGAREGTHDDPWASIFHLAAAAKKKGESDLIPFWVYSIKNGATIERHVPALPLSRDTARELSLRRALTLYRMAFGQVRQEDLVDYLQQRLPLDVVDQVAAELRIDLSPPKAPWSEMSGDADRIAFRSTEIVADDPWGLGSKEAGEVVLTAEGLAELLERYAELDSMGGDANDALVRYRELLDEFRRCRSAV